MRRFQVSKLGGCLPVCLMVIFQQKYFRVSCEPKLSLIGGALATETKFSAVKAVRVEHPNRRTLSNTVTLQVIKDMLEKQV